MSCKLECPNCGITCKEEGDEMKEAQATYKVRQDASMTRSNYLTCSSCKKESDVSEWKF